MSAHTADMGGLQRIISEQCYNGARISDPRPDISDGLVFWQRPEWLSKKLKTDIHTAQRLIDAWISLEFTTKMVLKAIKYMDGTLVWQIASKRSGGMMPLDHTVEYAFAKTVNMAHALDAVTVHADEFIPDGTFVDENNLHSGYKPPDEEQEMRDEEMDYYVPSIPVKFIPVGLGPEDESTPWIERQPQWIQDLIRNLKRINRLDELGAVGKAVFADKSGLMTAVQTSVFWTEYNNRKEILESRTRRNFTKLYAFLLTTTKKPGWLGRYLFNLQKGGKLALSNLQWNKIWEVWKVLHKTAKRTPPPPPPIQDDPQYHLFT